MKIFLPIFLLVFMSISSVSGQVAAQTASNSINQTEWIANVLKDIQKFKIGMTRGDLRKTFAEEGGISSTSQRTYVYAGCPYIKVDFQFEPRGPEIKNAEGVYRRRESDIDVIVKISKPYLEFSIVD